MRDLEPLDVDSGVTELPGVDRNDARTVLVAHHDVVAGDRYLDVVAVDGDDLRDHARPGERSRDAQRRAIRHGAAQNGEVAVLRAVGLDDHAGFDAALLSEQRRVHVRHVLADDVREDALERREPVHADIERGEFPANLDVQRGQRAVGQAREVLPEHLDKPDTGTHERVDDAAGDVDRVRDEIAFERELDRLRNRDAGLLLRLIGRSSEVRRCDDVRKGDEFRCRRVGLGRLGGEDIKSGTGDLAGGESLEQRLFVEQSTASDVDDVRRGLHRRELLGADHARRLGRLRHVHREEVALAHNLVEAQQLDTQLLGTRRGDIRVVPDQTHTEGPQTLGDQGADPAEAQDADGLLEQFRARERAALPLALRERGVGGGDVAGKAQDVPDGEFRGRDHVGRRCVDDHDAGGSRCLDVDVVEPDARAGDHAKLLRGCNGLGIHLRR